jgi:hypothetical protein
MIGGTAGVFLLKRAASEFNTWLWLVTAGSSCSTVSMFVWFPVSLPGSILSSHSTHYALPRFWLQIFDHTNWGDSVKKTIDLQLQLMLCVARIGQVKVCAAWRHPVDIKRPPG